MSLHLIRTNELIETQNQLLIEQQRAMDHMLHILEQIKSNINKDTLLDNAELKTLLKVADTKFFKLKAKKVFKVYDLYGKDYYFQSEVYEAIRNLNLEEE